jgi:hypothetical protein
MKKAPLAHLYKRMTTIFLIVVVVLLAIVYYSLRADCLPEGAVVYIVPVYGQSLALGEETTLVTDIDDYGAKTQHRVKSEFLNERIGYYADKLWKQRLKSVFRHENRHFETSVFGLGECFVKLNPNSKVYLCTFPAGQGETQLSLLGKGAKPYNKFIEEIRMVYDKAAAQGAKVVMPAFCWMQGENDLVWNTKYNYASLLKKFRIDVEHDVKVITHQQQSVNCILYQTNCLTLTKDEMNPSSYVCRQVSVPEQQRQLIIHDKHFFACGPVYPYNVARNYVHIDAYGQKQMGYLEGLALHRLMNGEKFIGLQPKTVFRHGDTLIVKMHVPVPPLIIDTITVTKVPHYGFSVITSTNQNVLKDVKVSDNQVYLICSRSLTNQVKVRYGVNGDYMKSGRLFGSRGNLRDSQGNCYQYKIKGRNCRLDNWCYMFELLP